MDAEVQNITFAVKKFDGFLHFPFHFNFLQAAEFPNAVVNMRYVIAHFQISDFL